MLRMTKAREKSTAKKEERKLAELSELLNAQTRLLAELSSAQKEHKELGGNREKLQKILDDGVTWHDDEESGT
jgi:uncharacterized protein YlxW (UPF0749 family)